MGCFVKHYICSSGLFISQSLCLQLFTCILFWISSTGPSRSAFHHSFFLPALHGLWDTGLYGWHRWSPHLSGFLYAANGEPRAFVPEAASSLQGLISFLNLRSQVLSTDLLLMALSVFEVLKQPCCLFRAGKYLYSTLPNPSDSPLLSSLI